MKSINLNKRGLIISKQKKQPDLGLLFIVSILSLFGMLMVYDSSTVQAFQNLGDRYYFIRQQAVWMLIGFLALCFFSYFDYRHLAKISFPSFLLSFLLLLLVFIPGLGISAGGAHRWLKISFLTVQPTEIIKLTSIFFFSAIFSKRVITAPFLVSVSAVSIIIGLFQKDLGSTIVFIITSFGIYFATGAPLIYFLGFIPLLAIGAVGFIASSSYRKQRILAFLDPFTDPQGYSYHISQILIALGSGGLFGLGIGQSRQKFAYIPEVTTDSIFSIIGEELGFIGGLVLVSLFVLLIIKGFKIAKNAGDSYGRILAAGITIWLGTQAAVNLAAMVSLIPLTGVPLPFISYGGSALLVNLVAIGILLNISKSTKN